MFVDEVEAEGRVPGTTCSVALFLASRDKKERDEIVAVLDDPAWESARIVRALHKRGHKINPDTIRRHRRRADGTGCQCPS